MPVEKGCATLRDRRRPGRAGDDDQAQGSRAAGIECWSGRPSRRALAPRRCRTGCRFQLPNLAVPAAGFPFPHSDPDALRRRRTIVRYIEAYASRRPADPLRRRGDAAVAGSGRAPPASSPRPPTARSRPTMSSSPPVPYQRTLVPDPLRALPVFQVHAAVPTIPNSFRRAPCWWPAPARRARRSPRNCSAPAAASISRSDGTARLPRRYRGRDFIWWLADDAPRSRHAEERGPRAWAPSFPAPMAVAPSISATSPPTA